MSLGRVPGERSFTSFGVHRTETHLGVSLQGLGERVYDDTSSWNSGLESLSWDELNILKGSMIPVGWMKT